MKEARKAKDFLAQDHALVVIVDNQEPIEIAAALMAFARMIDEYYKLTERK